MPPLGAPLLCHDLWVSRRGRGGGVLLSSLKCLQTWLIWSSVSLAVREWNTQRVPFAVITRGNPARPGCGLLGRKETVTSSRARGPGNKWGWASQLRAGHRC